MRFPTGLLLACTITGCASVSTTAPARYAEVTPELAAAGAGVEVIAGTATHQRIGEVSVFACQRAEWDPIPTEAYALALLKQAAAQKGANAILNVRHNKAIMSLTGNCWQNIRSSAIAARTPT